MPLNTADAIKALRQAASAADNSDLITGLTADRNNCMRPPTKRSLSRADLLTLVRSNCIFPYLTSPT